MLLYFQFKRFDFSWKGTKSNHDKSIWMCQRHFKYNIHLQWNSVSLNTHPQPALHSWDHIHIPPQCLYSTFREEAVLCLEKGHKEDFWWCVFSTIARNNSVLALNLYLPLSKGRVGLTFLEKYLLDTPSLESSLAT